MLRRAAEIQQPNTPWPPQHTRAKLAASFSRGVQYARSDSKWKRITEAVAFYKAKDQVPIYTVEKDGFKNLLRVIGSHGELLSCKHFGSVVLPAMHNTTHTRVTEQLEEVAFYRPLVQLDNAAVHEFDGALYQRQIKSGKHMPTNILLPRLTDALWTDLCDCLLYQTNAQHIQKQSPHGLSDGYQVLYNVHGRLHGGEH